MHVGLEVEIGWSALALCFADTFRPSTLIFDDFHVRTRHACSKGFPRMGWGPQHPVYTREQQYLRAFVPRTAQQCVGVFSVWTDSQMLRVLSVKAVFARKIRCSDDSQAT